MPEGRLERTRRAYRDASVIYGNVWTREQNRQSKEGYLVHEDSEGYLTETRGKFVRVDGEMTK